MASSAASIFLPSPEPEGPSFQPLALPLAEALMSKAQAASRQAYAPYSHFPVGAALLIDTKQVVTGCNVENMSYGLTLCAERTALVKAISQGLTPPQFKAIAVWAETTDHHGVLPCGACRQVMQEFLAPLAPVIFYHPHTGELTQWPMAQLLPAAFDNLPPPSASVRPIAPALPTDLPPRPPSAQHLL